MRALLTFGLLLLGGCTHTSPKTDISGIWINQTILDAAALSQPLNTQGSNLEWNIDIRAGKAQVSSGFEMAEGNLLQTSPDAWTVDYGGYSSDALRLDGKQLIQLGKEHMKEQVFSRPIDTAKTEERWGSTFRRALNAAYMGGKWRIIEGPGTGETVTFTADGQVSGLAKTDRYELCLDGDCASQGAGNNTLFLTNGDVGNTWIFVRKGKQMEILQAINGAQSDEIPTFTPGPRQWLLEQQ